MAEETNNLPLNDERRTRLLSLGLEPPAPADEIDVDELRGDLLCDILHCPLPPSEHGARTSRHTAQQFRSILEPSLGQILADSKTDVSTLKRIKEYAKALGKQAELDTEKDVFLAIYFAAIAAALVFHRGQITEHTNWDLLQFFNTYAGAAWVPNDLGRLFRDATEGLPKVGTDE